MWVVPGLSWNLPLPPSFFLNSTEAKSSIKRKSDLLSIFYSSSNIRHPSLKYTGSPKDEDVWVIVLSKKSGMLRLRGLLCSFWRPQALSHQVSNPLCFGPSSQTPTPEPLLLPTRVTNCSLPQSLGSWETETEAITHLSQA